MNVISEANRIKDRLRACTSAEQIEQVADQERAAVTAMATDADGKPLAIQIANLKRYRLRCLQA